MPRASSPLAITYTSQPKLSEYNKYMSMTSTYSSPEQTTPLLSFVMPAYKGQWLSSAVESILAQTYTNIELIVG